MTNDVYDLIFFSAVYKPSGGNAASFIRKFKFKFKSKICSDFILTMPMYVVISLVEADAGPIAVFSASTNSIARSSSASNFPRVLVFVTGGTKRLFLADRFPGS